MTGWFRGLLNKSNMLVSIFDNVAYEDKHDGLFCAWLAKKRNA
jgi:hypothetical protein